MNAVKHGLSAEHVVIPGEDPEEFAALFRGLQEHCRPVGPVEERRVEEIAFCTWLRHRSRLIETGIMHNEWYVSMKDWACKEMERNWPWTFHSSRKSDAAEESYGTGADPDLLSAYEAAEKVRDEAAAELSKPMALLADTFLRSASDLELLARYVTNIDRRLRNATQDLERMQDRRKLEAAEMATVIEGTAVDHNEGSQGGRKGKVTQTVVDMSEYRTKGKKRRRVRL
jgi:hypothetical protein